MSYLVLARKWRPQTFEDVVGQEHVTRTLQNALKEDHLAHALLFSGPRGVGKTSIARILAKAMNCEKGPAPAPCNQCGICREITEGSAVDVLEVDGASNRGIDEIRQLRETIRFQPVRCRYRVFIIDEVHMLTKEAFNALLKTLEEPPPHVFFIFATTEPHRIPATIHSRCQHYEFRRIQAARLADHLDAIVEAEGMGLPREATLLLAREAEGSVRDSLSLLDQVAAYGAHSIEDVHEALGVLGTTVMESLAGAVMTGDVEGALSVAADVYRLGVDFQKFISDLTLFFRNLLILKKTSAEKGHTLVDLEEAEARDILDRFSAFSASSVLNILNTLMKGQAAIAASSTPRLSLELLLIQLCTMREVASVDELLDGIRAVLEKKGPEGPEGSERTGTGSAAQASRVREKEGSGIPPYGGSASLKPVDIKSAGRKSDNYQADSTGPGPSADKAVHGDDLSGEAEASGKDKLQEPGPVPETRAVDRENWEEFVRFISARKPPLGSIIGAADVVDISGNTIKLCCDSAMHHEMLSEKDYSDTLSEMGLQFFGTPVNMEVARHSDTKSGKGPASTAGDRRKQLLNTPLVQEALDLFGARISALHLYKGDRRTGRRKKR